MKKDKVIEFANAYIEKHVKQFEKSKSLFLKDAWKALLFFMSKIYNQGRRDEISHRVEEAAIKILEPYKNNGTLFSESVFGEIEEKLKTCIGKGFIGKGADVKMTIDVLKFISKISENNIIVYSLEKIKQQKLAGQDGHFEELKTIYSIGDKIASFYLRDLISIYGLEKNLSKEDYCVLQPIDTWVKQTAIAMNIIVKDDTLKISINKIVDYCLALGLSPIQFNQGIWYMGANSYNILLDEIKS